MHCRKKKLEVRSIYLESHLRLTTLSIYLPHTATTQMKSPPTISIHLPLMLSACGLSFFPLFLSPSYGHLKVGAQLRRRQPSVCWPFCNRQKKKKKRPERKRRRKVFLLLTFQLFLPQSEKNKVFFGVKESPAFLLPMVPKWECADQQVLENCTWCCLSTWRERKK